MRAYPNPKDYHNNEELILAYTMARGGADLVATVLGRLNQVDTTIQVLTDKEVGKKRWF